MKIGDERARSVFERPSHARHCRIPYHARMRTRNVAKGLILLTLCCTCVQSGRDPVDPYAAPPPVQGLHGIDPQRLHYLMAKLSEMQLDQLAPDDLDDPQPDPNLIRAAGMGVDMVEDARSLPDIAGEGMSAAERRTLNRYASIYRDAARELARADERQDVPRVRRALYQVTRTCNECHVALGGPHFAFDQSGEASNAPPAEGNRSNGRPPARPRRRNEPSRGVPPEQPPPAQEVAPGIDDDL